MQQYYYKWQKLSAKAAYHLRTAEIFSAEIDNTNDPDARHKLIAMRSHHRRMARKYIAKADICWKTCGKE